MAFQSSSTDPFYELMRQPVDETPTKKAARQKREADALRIDDGVSEELAEQVERKKEREKNISTGSLLLGQSESDPFHDPIGETPAQKTARQQREADVQRINGAIDEELEQERAKKRREKNNIKVLLLGQSESGKSTVLKNFRMAYGMAGRDKERNGWRAVVQLAVVCAVLNILKVVEAELNGDIPAANSEGDHTFPKFDSTPNEVESMIFTILILRLAPLYRVEAALNRQLGIGSNVTEGSITPMSAVPSKGPDLGNLVPRNDEFPVQSWRKILDRVASSSINCDTVTSTFAECKGDMQALWENRAIHLVLKKQRLELPYSTSFFLNDLDRIASRDFVVTDDDILRVEKGNSKSVWAKRN